MLRITALCLSTGSAGSIPASVFQYGKVAEGTKASDCKSLQPGVRIPLLPPEHSRSTELENGQ